MVQHLVAAQQQAILPPNEEGGIESVEITNPGSGYDMIVSPIVRVIDLGQNYAVIGARLTAKVGAGEGLSE